MKRLALDAPPAIARGLTLRPAGISVSAPDTRRRDLGELASKTIIVVLFSLMAVRLAADARATGHITGVLLMVSEALVVVLTVFRRPAGLVDRRAKARLLTALSMFGPPLVRPASLTAVAPETITALITGVGLLIVVSGKLSLGRSFGLAPANRGIVCSGIYRFVRHPIYLGYLLTHIGFLLANPTPWNLSLLICADIALMFRAMLEEQALGLDFGYREYMQRVHWRILPGIF
jgi:protein-S-isoprenylcysteine O-methyltransferase Ste14